MLTYIYDHLHAFRLIFCCSEGTRWSAYLEELISIEERAYRLYCDSLGKSSARVEDMFLATCTPGALLSRFLATKPRHTAA